MAFCPNCGAAVEGRFCAKCGAAVPASDQAPQPAAQPYSGSTAAGAQPYSAPAGGAQPYDTPAPPPAPQAQTGGLTENVAGALCYLLGFITGILFLVLEPHNRNPFVRFHAFQSIFFNIAWFVFWIAFSIVEMIIFTVLPSLIGLLTSLLSLVIGLGGIALWVFLMYKAYNHERFKLPLVGDLAEKQA